MRKQNKLDVFYEDDGVGTPVANKPHIFKEGYGTGESTGYRLNLVKKMMEVHGCACTKIRVFLS
jgi:signal transduction histidine kinase